MRGINAKRLLPAPKLSCSRQLSSSFSTPAFARAASRLNGPLQLPLWRYSRNSRYRPEVRLSFGRSRRAFSDVVIGGRGNNLRETTIFPLVKRLHTYGIAVWMVSVEACPMEPSHTLLMTDRNSEITAAVVCERSKLASFIRRRVRDPSDAEDILQDVFHEFVQAYRLPEPIEQASAWLFRVARNRIIDRLRKKVDRPAGDMIGDSEDAESEYRLDLALPSLDAGPEAVFARSVMLAALQRALDELPPNQRDVFIAHEIEGSSFKDIASQSGVAINTLLARKRYAVLHLRARLQTVYDELDI